MVHADRRAMPSRVVCLGVSFRPDYCELGLLFLYTQQQHQHHALNIRRQPAGIISTEEKEEEEISIKKRPSRAFSKRPPAPRKPKGNQAGHSPERTVKGQSAVARTAARQ